MTNTLGQGLSGTRFAQLGLQRIDRVEELVGEPKGPGYVEEDPDADPG